MPLNRKYDATLNSSNKSWVVPNGETWKLMYGRCSLITTATVGNRQIVLEIQDASANIVFSAEAGAVQAASLTREYEFMQGVYRETAFIVNSIQFPIPQDCLLLPGWTLRIYDSATVDAAADDMTVAFTYNIHTV